MFTQVPRLVQVEKKQSAAQKLKNFAVLVYAYTIDGHVYIISDVPHQNRSYVARYKKKYSG